MAKARILVAEDEGVSARLIEMMLRSLGYAVPVVISSGEEAIKKAGEVHPDLVLMDILLEGDMDGVQAAEEINTRFNIPVVYLTAYAENDILQRAKITEPYGYILKPFKKMELHTTIDAALYKHKMDSKLKEREQALEKLTAELKANNEQLQREITEHKRAEEKLRGERDKAQTYLDIAGVIIMAIDTVGKVTLINRKGCQILGYREEEIVGKNWVDNFVPNRIKSQVLTILEKLLSGGIESAEFYENPVLTRSGEERLIAWHNSVLRDEAGNIVGILCSGEDITERKRAVESLRASEEKFHNLVESVPVGLIITTPDGRIIEANKAIVQMHRYDSKEEFMKMPPTARYYDPADRERFLSLVAKGPVNDFEVRRKRYGGTSFWASLSSIPQITESGEQVLITVVQDITKRKQAEEALIESEARYRALINLGAQVGEAVVMLQDEGSREADHIFCSDAWLQITGYSREELRNITMGKLLHPKDREAFLARHRRRMSGESIPGLFELTIIRKDGTEVPIELTSAYSTYQGKRVDVVYARDITRRKQVHEALRQSEEKLRLMFEALPDGITVLDADGKIVQVNKAAAHIHGYDDKEEMTGLNILELIDKQEHPRIREIMKKTLKEGYLGAPIEVTDLRKDRSKFPAEVSGAVLKDAPGNPTGLITITKDITERKQAQRTQERFSQQLQAKVSELEALSYGIAHDLRSPLLSIEGFSRLLRDDIQNQRMEGVQEDIRLLESGVSKMQQLLNRTLEYSRAGHLVKLTKNIPFGKIAKEVIKEFDEQLCSIGATVSLAETFPRVCVDKTRIRQVLTNLIQNSIKYRSEARPLKIEIGHRLSKDGVIFFVRDNGTGIDDSEKEKVFDLFYRGTTDGEGSGAGLAIVKRIIEAHGGKIWVQAQQEKGATMCFTLPQQNGTNKEDNNGED